MAFEIRSHLPALVNARAIGQRLEPVHLTPPPLSDAFLATLRRVARETLGRSSPEGSLLAAAIRDVSHYYTRDRSELDRTGGDTAPLSARLRFFLPRDMYKVWAPLSELWALSALPAKAQPSQASQGSPVRVLDLGAGLGTTALGVASFAASVGWTDRIALTACDQDARALSILTRLLPAVREDGGLVSAQVALETRTIDLAQPAKTDLPRRGFELVTAGLCLNELTAHETDEARQTELALAWLAQAFEYVSDDGALVVLEPALRPESRLIQRVRDALVARGGAPYVFAPCPGTRACPMLSRERDWCHDLIRYDLPRPLAELARGAGLRTGDLTFSYLTLRRQPGHVGALGGADRTLFRIVGGPLRTKGKLEFDLCGDPEAFRANEPQARASAAPADGAGGADGAAGPAFRLLRLDRHRDRRHDVLASAQRGTLLGLQPDDYTVDVARRRLRLNPGRQPVVYEAARHSAPLGPKEDCD